MGIRMGIPRWDRMGTGMEIRNQEDQIRSDQSALLSTVQYIQSPSPLVRHSPPSSVLRQG